MSVVFFFSGTREKVARGSYAWERTRALSQRIIKKKHSNSALYALGARCALKNKR